MPFLGSDEIVSEEPIGDYIKVTVKREIKDKEPVEFSSRVSPQVLEAARTEMPADDSILRDKKCDIIVQEIMGILLKHNVHIHKKTGDIQQIFSMLSNMIENSLIEAERQRWGIHPYDMDILTVHNEITK